MVTADEIRSRTFLVALRGYDRDEVKAFLSQVADAIAALQDRVRDLEAAEVPAGQTDSVAEEPAAEPPAGDGAAPEESVPEPSPFAEIGQQTQRILEAAQQAAEEIRTKARADADREVKQARSQAARLIAEGERRREDVERVVEALTGARAELSDDLRGVGRTIERVLRELAPEPAAATVRQALAVAVREEAGEEPPPAAEVTASERGRAGEDAPPAEEAADGAKVSTERAADGGEAPPLEEAGDGAETPRLEEAGDGVEPDAALPDEPRTGDNGEAKPSSGVAADEQALTGPGPRRPQRAGVPAALATAAPAGAAANGDIATDPDATPEPAVEAGEGLLHRTQALAPLHPRLVRKLKRGLQDLQNATLDLLRRNPERSDVEPFLPDSSAVQTLAALAEEQLSLANAAGTAAGAEATGTPVSLEPSGEALAAQLGSELGGVLVTRLADTLRSGFDAGQGMSALTERVDVVFTRMKSQAAGDVAAVALVRAYEGGQRDAWAVGGVTHRRWVRAVEPACTDPRCVDNEAAGPVPVGERFPSRHDAPPVRPGCHCSTAAVRR